jgi:hypothetical protein
MAAGHYPDQKLTMTTGNQLIVTETALIFYHGQQLTLVW